MSEKSYVSMEYKMCPICGEVFNTKTILLDKRLKNSLERTTITGYDLCEDDFKLYEDGYVALIGVDASKSTFERDGSLKLEKAHRSGKIVHIKHETYDKLFNNPVPEKIPFVFTEPEVIDQLERLQSYRKEE